jgi:hypothetical protein
MVATPVRFDESLSGWERALYAFLAEGERRSGSRRTSLSDLSSALNRNYLYEWPWQALLPMSSPRQRADSDRSTRR